jgi:hypothetical protein
MSVTPVKTSKRIFFLIGVFLIGCLVGNEWRIFRNYETFIYPVSLYSRRLHQLAASQDLAGLTNAVLEFDEKFNRHQSAQDLQDAVAHVVKTGVGEN